MVRPSQRPQSWSASAVTRPPSTGLPMPAPRQRSLVLVPPLSRPPRGPLSSSDEGGPRASLPAAASTPPAPTQHSRWRKERSASPSMMLKMPYVPLFFANHNQRSGSPGGAPAPRTPWLPPTPVLSQPPLDAPRWSETGGATFLQSQPPRHHRVLRPSRERDARSSFRTVRPDGPEPLSCAPQSPGHRAAARRGTPGRCGAY